MAQLAEATVNLAVATKGTETAEANTNAAVANATYFQNKLVQQNQHAQEKVSGHVQTLAKKTTQKKRRNYEEGQCTGTLFPHDGMLVSHGHTNVVLFFISRLFRLGQRDSHRQLHQSLLKQL